MSKKILSFGFMLQSAKTALMAEELNIAIVADIHVMDASLVVEDGLAFEQYVDSDRKMLKESPALLKELTQRLLADRPKYLIVPGDLTKDGERLSHEFLFNSSFKVLLEAGIQPLVIPGNHDINNPNAVEFVGDEKRRVETITADDFARIYAECGYAGASARDTHSLSYTYRLGDTMQLLAIDACRYEDNDYEISMCYHNGVVRKGTYDFIEKQLIMAQVEGLRTIVVMHHGIVEHWKYQKKMLPGYIVDEDKKLVKLFRKYGVEVVFTGHSHAQDISCEGGIYDVQTGSMVSYPCPYRLATIDNSSIVIESRLLDKIDFDLQGMSLEEFARANTQNGFKFYLEKMFPEMIPAEVMRRAVDLIAEGMTRHYAGDEYFDDEFRAEMKLVQREIRRHSWAWSFAFRKIARSLFSDPGPADNNLTITFKS